MCIRQYAIYCTHQPMAAREKLRVTIIMFLLSCPARPVFENSTWVSEVIDIVICSHDHVLVIFFKNVTWVSKIIVICSHDQVQSYCSKIPPEFPKSLSYAHMIMSWSVFKNSTWVSKVIGNMFTCSCNDHSLKIYLDF